MARRSSGSCCAPAAFCDSKTPRVPKNRSRDPYAGPSRMATSCMLVLAVARLVVGDELRHLGALVGGEDVERLRRGGERVGLHRALDLLLLIEELLRAGEVVRVADERLGDAAESAAE